MSEYLYEKDLRGMKYHIMASTLHDRLVRTLAERYGLKRQEILKQLFEKCDMLLLENLPTRYDVWLNEAQEVDPVARALGCDLLTKYVPIISREDMDMVLDGVQKNISGGMSEDAAVGGGIKEIQELILT